MTDLISLISSPLEATSVATRIFLCDLLKSCIIFWRVYYKFLDFFYKNWFYGFDNGIVPEFSTQKINQKAHLYQTIFIKSQSTVIYQSLYCFVIMQVVYSVLYQNCLLVGSFMIFHWWKSFFSIKFFRSTKNLILIFWPIPLYLFFGYWFGYNICGLG